MSARYAKPTTETTPQTATRVAGDWHWKAILAHRSIEWMPTPKHSSVDIDENEPQGNESGGTPTITPQATE